MKDYLRYHEARSGSDGPGQVLVGETSQGRTAYLALALVCMFVLAGLLGYRTIHSGRGCFAALNFPRLLVAIMFFSACSFTLCSAVVVCGLNLENASICQSAVAICVAFYVCHKSAMYMFLIERVRAVRVQQKARIHDWTWIACTSVTLVGLGALTISSSIWNFSDISTIDGRCRIGIPTKIAMTLVVADIVINTALTAIFIYYLQPLVKFGGLLHPASPANRFTKTIRRMFKRKDELVAVESDPMNRNFPKHVENLLWRSLVGVILVLFPTIGNIVSLYMLHGRELATVCLSVCTLDVTWSVCVVHWLTVGEIAIEYNKRASGMSSMTGQA